MEKLTTKNFFAQDSVKKKFDELLGNRAASFITSVLQIANSNAMLAGADPMSIYNAAATAATLDLPLNNNLGFAYIIPFKNRDRDGVGKTSNFVVARICLLAQVYACVYVSCL